jgi:hypothetical protein
VAVDCGSNSRTLIHHLLRPATTVQRPARRCHGQRPTTLPFCALTTTPNDTPRRGHKDNQRGGYLHEKGATWSLPPVWCGFPGDVLPRREIIAGTGTYRAPNPAARTPRTPRFAVIRSSGLNRRPGKASHATVSSQPAMMVASIPATMDVFEARGWINHDLGLIYTGVDCHPVPATRNNPKRQRWLRPVVSTSAATRGGWWPDQWDPCGSEQTR